MVRRSRFQVRPNLQCQPVNQCNPTPSCSQEKQIDKEESALPHVSTKDASVPVIPSSYEAVPSSTKRPLNIIANTSDGDLQHSHVDVLTTNRLNSPSPKQSTTEDLVKDTQCSPHPCEVAFVHNKSPNDTLHVQHSLGNAEFGAAASTCSENLSDEDRHSVNKTNAEYAASLCSRSSRYSLSSCDGRRRRSRKRFTGAEPLDPKKMTMQDLILWNPKNEKRPTFDNLPKSVTDVPTRKPTPTVAKTSAPQVKIAEDGSLIVDESSLTVVQGNEPNDLDTVREDFFSRRITSMSFRKNPFKRGAKWREKETDLFYEVIRATGSDFSLMQTFLPSRNRNELKCKYNREMRVNSARLNHALSKPLLLNDCLHVRVKKCLEDIAKEEASKKQKLPKYLPKNRRFKNSIEAEQTESNIESEFGSEENVQRINMEENSASIASGSEETDLIGDKADSEIVQINRTGDLKRELIEKTAKEAAEVVKKRKLEKSRAGSKQLIMKTLSKLSRKFPKFELTIDDTATSVSIENGSEGLTTIIVPVGTAAKVLRANKKMPERIEFNCTPFAGIPAKTYVVQYENDPHQSSGFLRIFDIL